MAETDRTSSRREFLRLASLGAAGAAASTAAGGGAAEAGETPAEPGGYRETAHVRAYLESCRF